MRLKSIEIQGFKSFAERTRLNFDDGITAVIGPNGSGKSNIADAVRWVLGEQSTRTLRGGKMEDVIFGGTQTRKAQGVASVTLVMDNADRSLCTDADEVAVTRRLYRSGDSEYRVNGAPVRLRDVNELFMDTGLGRDGYSIIGQGRVAEIVSARAKERREIFEEAAGISKFRYRKTEAERQLAFAEENMVRLRDILAELDARIAPLREQSEKAQAFLDLATQKKTLEVSVWMRMLDQLRTKISALEDKLLLAQTDYDAADADTVDQQAQFASEMERGNRLMMETETLRAEAEHFAEEVVGWQSELAILRNDISHHGRAIEEAEQAIRVAGQSRAELEEEMAQKRASIVLQQQGIDESTAASQALEERRAALVAEQAAATQALESLRGQRTGVFEALESARLGCATASTMLDESQSRLGEMVRQEQSYAETIGQLEQERIDCDTVLHELQESDLSMQNAAKGYQLKRTGRLEKGEALEQKRTALDRLIEEKRQRAKLLSDMDRNMEGFGSSVKYIMAQTRAGALSGVYGPVSSLLRTEEAYTVAIETALGGAMQNIVVEEEETAKRAIERLRVSRAGRATFLPLTAIHGSRLDLRGIDSMEGFVGLACDLVESDATFSEIVTSLLGRVVVARDLDCAVQIAREHRYRFRTVTLDGQVVNAGGSMTGGFTVKSAGILGRQGEIDALSAQAKALETDREQLVAACDAAARELSAVDAELAAIDAQRRTQSEDRIRCETQRARIEQTLVLTKKQAEHAEQEREAVRIRIEEMRQKSVGSEALSEQLTAELDTLQQQIAAGGEHRAALDLQQTQLSDRLTEQNTHRLLLERDLETANREIEHRRETLETAEQQRAALDDKIARLREQVEVAAERIMALNVQIEQGRVQSAQSQGEILRRMEQHSQSERRCTELRAQERETTARRDLIYRELVRFGEQKKALQTERGALIAKLYDEYELSQSDAENWTTPIEDFDAANRQLAELRGKIKALGSVNVGAIEEYNEISLRHRTMTRQLTDVDQSKAELTRLIGELTGQMGSIFSDRFAQINDNFSQVFHELFEGGSASLSLTDPGDVLESGIDITVRPPGKLIKNLASLSGGEQAFVAIAIFFAILKVNPSPFCLMDEIEAALDDVNVAKFAAYLHTMTDRTQFIAITHRRGTMEGADVLYGVTMQEEGVSKLLELKVSELGQEYGVK